MSSQLDSANKQIEKQSRNYFVDEMRGLAFILMAIFHFSFDLSVFGFITFDNGPGSFFSWFRFLIVTLFFSTVGISLYMAHSQNIRWKSFAKREMKIFAGALFITVSTYVMYPNAWVYFGVLHFIAVASILSLPLIFNPKMALPFGILVFILYNTTTWFNTAWLYNLSNSFLHLPPGTQDLTRLIPWIGMIWIGIFIGYLKIFGIRQLPYSFLSFPLRWLGRHSLIFYVVHQVPLFGLAWLLNFVFHS